MKQETWHSNWNKLAIACISCIVIWLLFILGNDHRLFSRSRFSAQHSKNSLAINSIGQWQYRSFELERRIKTNILLLQCYETKNKLTSIHFLPYNITTTLRNFQLHCFPTTLLSCIDATVADKDRFMYRQNEMGEKQSLLTVLCSLFLSGQMQTYWCPLWWLFVCASENKALSSSLLRSPGLHLWIFKKRFQVKNTMENFSSMYSQTIDSCWSIFLAVYLI